MAKNVKVKVDSRAIEALLKSSATEQMLLGHARRIAARAGPGMEATSQIGATRARASVITATTEARLAEANQRRLSSALSGA